MKGSVTPENQYPNQNNQEETHIKPEIKEDVEKRRQEFLHKIPEPLLIDFDALEEKPWEKPGADPSDYFNYGFDENTYKIYQHKVRDNFITLDRGALMEQMQEENLDLDHENINFYLPHEAGGCGATQSQDYDVVNTYRIGKSNN